MVTWSTSTPRSASSSRRRGRRGRSVGTRTASTITSGGNGSRRRPTVGQEQASAAGSHASSLAARIRSQPIQQCPRGGRRRRGPPTWRWLESGARLTATVLGSTRDARWCRPTMGRFAAWSGSASRRGVDRERRQAVGRAGRHRDHGHLHAGVTGSGLRRLASVSSSRHVVGGTRPGQHRLSNTPATGQTTTGKHSRGSARSF